MAKIMITHHGAFGDNVFALPGLVVLRKHFEKVYMSVRPGREVIYANTGLVDKFVFQSKKLYELAKKLNKEKDEKRFNRVKKFIQYNLEKQLTDIDFDCSLTIHSSVPGKFLFIKENKQFKWSNQKRRELNEGVNYYDEFSRAMGVYEQARGMRPVFKMNDDEEYFSKTFKKWFNIPVGARILTWQLTGSSYVKWYPFFQETAFELLKKFPDLYIIGTGWHPDWNSDVRHLKWNEPRFINGGDLDFRKICIVASKSDLLISPDTGVFNMCGAFDVPKILLATHTSGKQVAGYFTNCEIVSSKAKCAPCYKIVRDCKTYGKPWVYCAGKIDKNEIIEKAERFLQWHYSSSA